MKIFQLNKTYKLKLFLDGEISYFKAKIINEDETHFKFIDKFDKEFTYSKDTIKSSELFE